MLFVQRSVQLFLDFAKQTQDSGDRKLVMPGDMGWMTALPEGGFVGQTHPDLAIGGCSGRFISKNLLLYTYDFIVIEPMHCAAVSMREGEYCSLLAISSGSCTALKRSLAAESVTDANFRAENVRPGQRVAGIIFIQSGDDVGTLQSLWQEALAARLGGESCRQTPWPVAAAGIVDQILAPPFTGHVREHYICGKAIELLCQMSVATTDMNPRRNEVLMVCERMAADLSVPLNINDLARYVDLSAGHLMRVFKTATGMTMRDYHLDLRLRRASTLLSQSKARIHDIAADLGFADAPQFSKSFKRKFGHTPMAQRHQAMSERRDLSVGNIGAAH